MNMHVLVVNNLPNLIDSSMPSNGKKYNKSYKFLNVFLFLDSLIRCFIRYLLTMGITKMHA